MNKKLFVSFILFAFLSTNSVLAKSEDLKVVDGKFKCVSERSDIYNDSEIFELKDGKLYDKDGRYLSKAKISEEEISFTYKVRSDYSLKNSKYKINRKTGKYRLRVTLTSYYRPNIIQSKGFCLMIK